MARGAVALAAGLVLALAVAAAPTGAGGRARLARCVFRFVDHTRVAVFRDGTRRPRVLVTYVHYPRGGRGPFPLVVFGHGFALVPGAYARLLDAWAAAGYVVAAPVFPVESANAPGGPDERDLGNQPGDMSFVISRLLAADERPGSVLHGLIDPHRIAVAGHSDGAETAFAVAYERGFRDRRVRAAVILSGAVLPPASPAAARPSPALLAVQGTGDRINPPRASYELFRSVGRPKYLLRLPGAGHLPPYSSDRRRLAVVERVTIAFLDRYLRHGSQRALIAAGRSHGIARLTAAP